MMWAQGFAAGCKMGNVPDYLFRFRLDDNFFNRRRGWTYAKCIWQLRHRVNKMLGFGMVEDALAIAYAIAKMMPTRILNYMFKNMRVINQDELNISSIGIGKTDIIFVVHVQSIDASKFNSLVA